MTDQPPKKRFERKFETDRDPRLRWSYNVRFNGKPIARCDTQAEAEQIQNALCLADRVLRMDDPGNRLLQTLQDDARDIFR